MSSEKVKVAIIEDDQAIRHMYSTKLEEDGYDVKSAADGQAGLDLIKSFNPTVVLLDMMMPNMEGVEFLAIVRRAVANDNMKIIVLTNLDDAKLKQSLKGMDIDGYLVKAETTPSEVSEKIRSVLS